VAVRDSRGQSDQFDRVVMACHADQALALLADAAGDERDVLGAFSYARNAVVLHRDPGAMPRRRRIWSSWNYVADTMTPDAPARVTYWINRVQKPATAENIFVSINPAHEIADQAVHDRVFFEHPVFDARAIRGQRKLSALQGRRNTFFAGSYCGYGFHEDALSAAISVAAQLGISPPWTLNQTS
jgi:predicted NAD/FAD-binding protein